jgi:hypothetical protein
MQIDGCFESSKAKNWVNDEAINRKQTVLAKTNIHSKQIGCLFTLSINGLFVTDLSGFPLFTR